MRRNNKIDIRVTKQLARQKYAERQIDKWVKWRMEVKGYLFYKDLLLILSYENQYVHEKYPEFIINPKYPDEN